MRRAFLCGYDRFSDRSFDHRKGWIVEKLAELADVFAIEICAYAVLSNHFHLVLRIDSVRARGWSDAEVVERYGRLFPWAAAGWHDLPPAVAADRVRRWRARLYDVSWFMRGLNSPLKNRTRAANGLSASWLRCEILNKSHDFASGFAPCPDAEILIFACAPVFQRAVNESIARRANREDDCKGRFWEGRFRSQALLDPAAVLTCMSYVDLNPIRANLAETLEESDFTSIQQRLGLVAAADCGKGPPAEGSKAEDSKRVAGYRPAPDGAEDDEGTDLSTENAPRRPELAPFSTAGESNGDDALPLTLADYVDLLTATAAAVRAPDRKAALPAGSARTLTEIGIDSAHWIQTVRDYRRRFFTMVGSVHSIDVYCARTERQQVKGSVWAGRVFRDCA